MEATAGEEPRLEVFTSLVGSARTLAHFAMRPSMRINVPGLGVGSCSRSRMAWTSMSLVPEEATITSSARLAFGMDAIATAEAVDGSKEVKSVAGLCDGRNCFPRWLRSLRRCLLPSNEGRASIDLSPSG